MVIKDSQETKTEEILNCMIEVLSNSIKSELEKLLNLNNEESCIDSKSSLSSVFLHFQRKQLLFYLLNVKEINDLSNFTENFITLFGLDQNLAYSSIALYKLFVKIIEEAEKCKVFLNFLQSSNRTEPNYFVQPELEFKSDSHPSSVLHQCKQAEKNFNKNMAIVSATFDQEQAPKICSEQNCRICAKPFENKIKLIRHMHSSHAGEKIYKCDKCNKAFTKRNILNKHINFCHNDDVLLRSSNSFKCILCPKVFRQRHVLKQHTLVHSGEKPFECDFCLKKFAQKASLCRHVKTHSSNEAKEVFKCNKCQKEYCSKQGLKSHLKLHCVSVVPDIHKSDPYCDKRLSVT